MDKPILLEAITTQHSGPLPPPEKLSGYDKILPGLAERIVVMAETEQRARLASIVGENQDRSFGARFGRIAAAVYSMGVLGVAFYAIHKGSPSGAAIVIGLHAAGVCAQLISDRRQQHLPEPTVKDS